MRDFFEGYRRKTEYTTMSLIWREVHLKDATTFHLGSSLSQAEEQGALFAAGGPVKILVEFTELEVSPVWATDQQRWRLQLEGAELQTAQRPIGRLAERASVPIGRGQPVKPAGAPAQQILITANIQVNF